MGQCCYCIYNHFILFSWSRCSSNNLESLERISKLAAIIPDLHKVGLILASGMILSPETVIDNVDNIDVEDIDSGQFLSYKTGEI